MLVPHLLHEKSHALGQFEGATCGQSVEKKWMITFLELAHARDATPLWVDATPLSGVGGWMIKFLALAHAFKCYAIVLGGARGWLIAALDLVHAFWRELERAKRGSSLCHLPSAAKTYLHLLRPSNHTKLGRNEAGQGSPPTVPESRRAEEIAPISPK